MNKKSLVGSVLLLKQEAVERNIVWNKLFFVINVVKNLKRATRLHGILMYVRADNGRILKDDTCYNWDITVGNTDIERLLNGETDVNEAVNRVYHKSIDQILTELSGTGRVGFGITIKDRFVGKVIEFSTSKGDEMLARVINVSEIKADNKGQYVISMGVRTTQGGILFKKYSIVDTIVTVPLVNLCR